MAYYGYNGTITIDEVAANADITRIQAASDILCNAKLTVDQLAQQASDYQGQTALAITEKATELANRIATLIGKLESSAALIQNTVAYYRALDEKIKAEIESSGSMGGR